MLTICCAPIIQHPLSLQTHRYLLCDEWVSECWFGGSQLFWLKYGNLCTTNNRTDAAKCNGCADNLQIIGVCIFVENAGIFVAAKAVVTNQRNVIAMVVHWRWPWNRLREQTTHKSFRYLNWCMFEIKNFKSQSACMRRSQLHVECAQFIWVFQVMASAILG